MRDNKSPRVSVTVDALTLQPGETVTIYVTNADSMKTQIEVRSVGRFGNVGQPEIFCDDGDLEIQSFDDWQPMGEADRVRRGLPREPKPMQKGESDG